MRYMFVLPQRESAVIRLFSQTRFYPPLDDHRLLLVISQTSLPRSHRMKLKIQRSERVKRTQRFTYAVRLRILSGYLAST